MNTMKRLLLAIGCTNITVSTLTCLVAEFEPFDTNKRNEYNNTLLPHLDELICSIAETRKESPFLCVQQMAQECKYVHKDVVSAGHNLPDKSCVADTAMQIELA